MNKMDEYTIRSICEECGCKDAVVLYHVCDKMDDPKHDTCTDECHPRELPFHPNLHNREELSTFLRCKECDSLNTEKQPEW